MAARSGEFVARKWIE
jgi:hypothetical protein